MTTGRAGARRAGERSRFGDLTWLLLSPADHITSAD